MGAPLGKGETPEKILVVDIGGTHVKLLRSGERTARAFVSGRKLTPKKLMRGIERASADWPFDSVSIGFPAPIANQRPLREPVNLGRGWFGFDFERAFARPVQVLNDALMQAIGSYEGGTMLFLGLGTGLGSAMLASGEVEPLELAHLPYGKKGRTYEDYLGKRGLLSAGRKKWERRVLEVVEHLRAPLNVDYLVLGGGNAKKLRQLPPDCRLGSNEHAFIGGFRIWDEAWRSSMKLGVATVL